MNLPVYFGDAGSSAVLKRYMYISSSPSMDRSPRLEIHPRRHHVDSRGITTSQGDRSVPGLVQGVFAKGERR
eukprot:17003-Pyramimonas_sp.AAC.1